jgi:hypothetical protein
MRIPAASVKEYLSKLPEDRRAAISAVRDKILENLDAGYEEWVEGGMINYYVPHRLYPPGYHCDPKQPLPFAGLASQKNYMAVYLMSVYMDPSHLQWFTGAWKKSGKKLDMGKCCVRFKKVEDVALDVIGEAIRRVPAKTYIEYYEKSRAAQAKKKR